VAGIATVAIAVYMLAALVVFPEGDPSAGARLVALAVIGALLVAAWAIGRWAPRWARGLAMLLAGLAAITAVGAAVVERLGDGVAVSDALGLVAGAAGAFLVVGGWRRLLGGVPRAWLRAVIAVVATILVAQFVLLPAGVAVRATNRARPISSGRTPAAVGLAYEEVRITSSDGTGLAAWWVPSENGAAVIALPGASSTRENVLDHGALLAREGYGVLLLDYRGHGESEGRGMQFGWGAERDVSAAISHVLRRPEVTKRVGLLGLSMGGEIALTTAAVDQRVDAVVAEGASARTWEDARREEDAHPVSLANEWFIFHLVPLLTPAPEPIPLVTAVRRIRAPVLLIAGRPSNEATLSRLYAKTAPGVVTLWSLPDTAHTAALRTHPAEYRERVLEHFDEVLLGSG
jgi:pimeloyl-ACP methyl ester carboxylesterase